MADTPKPNKTPIRSTLANDPEMAELVAMFVADLSQRREAIQSALEGQRVDDLRRLAHQLRGCSASYGLKPIGEAAAKVEDAIKAMTGDAGAQLTRIRGEVDELIEMCDRAATA